jgi:thiamine pyrophosphate-dependent acetolactate synthase large subunit-like protein
MLVMDAIAEILKREGVSTLFCFPTTPIIEAAAAVGIKPVICRQERVGVHMADGFARVSNGRPPGVFAMQYGPGAENAFAGVATAFSDSSPVVFLPLGHPRETAQLFPMFKSSRTYASITKSVEEVILPEQVANVMRRAFAQVKNGRQGPVMVEVPDVVGDSVDDAHQQLEDAGFQVEEDRGLFGLFGDTVKGQSVAGGDKAPKGSTITIKIR